MRSEAAGVGVGGGRDTGGWLWIREADRVDSEVVYLACGRSFFVWVRSWRSHNGPVRERNGAVAGKAGAYLMGRGLAGPERRRSKYVE